MASWEGKRSSYPLLVFEICKVVHAADANKIRRNCSDHIMRRSRCIFHESCVFACFEVANRERSVSAVGTEIGKEGRWEREPGWEIQRRDVPWTLQTILSTGSLPLR